MARYAYHQVDTNQQAIIDALEAGGCTVSRIGRPVDLAVGKAGKTYLFEVKRPKGELRESQVRFIAGWRGHVGILRSVEDVQQFLRERQRGAPPGGCMSDDARTTFQRGDRVKLQDDVEAQFPAQAHKRGTVIGFGTKSEHSIRILWDGNKPSSVTSFHMKFIERVFNDK